MAKKAKKENVREVLEKDLIERHERWKEIFNHGCRDPFWSDGVNMNLVRNHIIYCRRKIEEELEPGQYPESYFWKVPQEVSPNYIADVEGIRRDAKKTLDAVLNHPDFAYLEKYPETHVMTKMQENKLAPVRYVRRLEEAVKGGDLVYARRYRDPTYLLEWMSENRRALEEYGEKKKVLPLGQLSIFDFM